MSLKKENAILRDLKNQSGADQQRLLEDRLHRLEKKFFGFGRESIQPKDDSTVRVVGHDGQKLNVHTERTIGTQMEMAAINDASQSHQKEKTKIGKHAPLAKVHDFSEIGFDEENGVRGMAKGLGKKPWKELDGLYQEATEITVTERVYQRVVHRQKKYKLRDEYNTTGKEVIITAPGPVKLRAGSEYSVDFALSVVSDKYEYHLPLERQRRKMEAAGLNIDVKTLYSLCEVVSEHVNTVLPAIKRDIQTEFVAVHLDESPWRILGTGDQGYMWVMSNRAGCYYQFEPTRSGKVPEEILEGYDGAIVTDAYGGYNRVRRNEKIRMQLCWAHARREFFERFEDFPSECTRAIKLIDELFNIESQATHIEHLRELRRSKSPAVITQLRGFCFETLSRFLPNEGISKAIAYVLNHWKELTHFLTDLTVPLSNNDAERALRHAVLGRKNFAGSKTINGADVAASLYTVIETCKKNSLQPNDYLQYLITERWKGREVLSPMHYAFSKMPKNTKIAWPSRDQWRV